MKVLRRFLQDETKFVLSNNSADAESNSFLYSLHVFIMFYFTAIVSNKGIQTTCFKEPK